MSQTLTNDDWVDTNFDGVDLKDKRRNNRLKKTVEKMVASPGESIPNQMSDWAESKAAYRLLSCDKVTFNVVQLPHRKKTKQLARKSSLPVLFIEDTTALDFTSHSKKKGLGPIGDHKGRGLMMHSCLAVEYKENTPQILGLAMQQLWRREEKPHKNKETRTERNNRHSESKIWSTTLRRIGNPPENSNWVEVGDRANDIFQFMDYCRKTKWNYVIRVCQNRVIKADEKITKIEEELAQLKEAGRTTVVVRRQSDTTKKEIELKVSYKEIEIQQPQRFKRKCKPCKIWVIRAWNEEENVDWKIYSSLCINNLKSAIEKLKWYALRWVIEEYHKCLKTGCKVQDRQLKSDSALKAMVGILGIIAIRLLEIRDYSRVNADQPAEKAMPKHFNKDYSKTISKNSQ